MGTSHDAPFNALFRSIRPPAMSQAVPSQLRLPHDTPMMEERSHDRPEKKPAAPFQPDPLKLEEFCQQYKSWRQTFRSRLDCLDFQVRCLHRSASPCKEIDEMKSLVVLSRTKRTMGSSRKLASATSVACARRVIGRGGRIRRMPHGISANSILV